MLYINIKNGGIVETVDEFKTYKEAKKMLKEYRTASNYYFGAYLSQRCTKDWKNK